MKKILFIFAVFTILLAGCNAGNPSGTYADSDSDQNFATVRGDQFLPIDFGVYTLTGTVMPIDVLFENGSMIDGVSFPSEMQRPYLTLSDKSLVKIAVTDATYKGSDIDVNGVDEITEAIKTSNLEGNVVIIKVTASSMFALSVGDTLSISCVAQAESLAAVAQNEPRSDLKVTWELDYCRPPAPVLQETSGK